MPLKMLRKTSDKGKIILHTSVTGFTGYAVIAKSLSPTIGSLAVGGTALLGSLVLWEHEDEY